MKRIALYLMIITVFSKVIGFTRDIVLSYYYGVSSITDAYLISLTIPNTVFAVIGTGIVTSFIPIYSSLKKEKNDIEANKFTSNVVNFILLVCTIIIITVLFNTAPVVKLFASGFEGETLLLTIRFIRISIFGIFFSGLIYVFTAFLQLKDDFLGPALMIVPYNILIIVSIILSYKTNSMVLAVGSIFATACQFMFLVRLVYKKKYKHSFVLDIKDKYLKKMLILAIPVIIGVSVNQINILVDRNIASRIIIGGISALSYASRLSLFIQGIFVLSITTVLYPMISKMAVTNDISGLKQSVSTSINSINLLVIPATVGAVIFAEQIVAMLFGRGAFDISAVNLTSTALLYYSLGMVAVGLREVLSKAFYAMKDTKTPMINASVGMFLNIILNLILSRFMGIGGLALATSISAIFTMSLMFISLKKKIGALGIKTMATAFMKILVASLVMGFAAKMSFNYLTNRVFSQNMSLIISIGVGAIIYLIIIYSMRLDDVNSFVNALKRKFS
jgi:putative peptidoglycan lipid II flippase